MMEQVEIDELYQMIWQEKSFYTKSYEDPKLVLLAGQPGSGKTALRNFTQEEFPQDFFVINSDDLRERHPNFVEMSKNDPKTASVLVQNIVTGWTQRLIEDAVKNKFNLLLDGTLSGKIAPIKATIELCLSKGYSSEIRFLAVHEKISKLGIYLRYEDQKRDKGYGRMVNQFSHDTGYTQIPENIRQLHDAGFIDNVKLYGKSRGSANVELLVKYDTYIRESLPELIESLRSYNLSHMESEFKLQAPQLIARMVERNANETDIIEFKEYLGLD